ncbi:MAG: MBL fold metallo-hydrolase [Deltaproteobacteria bacterium]|nr:MBL fold metallo-hydrolase [Deltaproteobacteria bacterium]
MTRLTVVCENTAGPVPGILGEHGLSVLIERSGGTLLFDTGQGRTIMHNLACLKKDPGRISRIALSHGHYDHTGGLEQVLQECAPVDVCCHPGALSERFVAVPRGSRTTYRSAGIPPGRPALEALGARFVFNTGFAEIGKGMYLTGEVPRTTSFEKNDDRLKVKQGARYMQDTIPDDQSLVIESKKGLVVVLGCAHSGMINTLNYIASQLPGRKINTVVGGTHIGFLGEKQLEATIEHLSRFRFQRLGVSHCTGLAPSMRLMQVFGRRFFFANAGTVLEIE